jgi:hypothetical protein
MNKIEEKNRKQRIKNLQAKLNNIIYLEKKGRAQVLEINHFIYKSFQVHNHQIDYYN